MSRVAVRRLSLAVAIAALVAACAIYASDGFDFTVVGLRLRANRIDRVIWLAAAGLAMYVYLGGRAGLAFARAVGRWIIRPPVLAVLLASLVFALGAAFGSRAAGGADSYGYLSQAQAWLTLEPATPQPWMTEVPWPNGAASWIPLGYRLGVDGSSIVSIYAPGLPMLLAAAMAVGGACAAFLVVPLSGVIAVYATYALGRRLHSEPVGLAAAWLLASSPVFVDMLLQTMSDVPSAAVWALAFLLASTGKPRAAFGSGVAASVAVLIRLNHVVLLVPLVAWFGIEALRDVASRTERLRTLVMFVAGLVPGLVTLGVLNWILYGSPASAGYGGSLSYWFGFGNVLPNLRRYALWVTEAQTPLIWLGLVAVFLPLSWLWPVPRARRFMVVVVGFIALLITQYLLFAVFEDAHYLRFLLTGAPLVFIAGCALAWALLSRLRSEIRAPALALLLLAPAITAWSADRYPWTIGRAQSYYRTAAEALHEVAPPGSVILSMQHSGSVRYYAGLLTLRFDYVEPDWLERSVAWLAERGVRTYALLEPWEVALWRERFAAAGVLGRLDFDPVLTVTPGPVALYDLERPASAPTRAIHASDADASCRPPADLPSLLTARSPAAGLYITQTPDRMTRP
jgi:hypothetical protein